MLHFNNIKELLNLLARTKELLVEMFEKRKSFSYKYDMALELVDETVLESLITRGVLRQNGAYIELDEQYLSFFEQVLEVNEDINTSYIHENIGQVKQHINYYLQESNEARKYSYLKAIKSSLRKIGRITLLNVIDLNRNIENAFKSEPNYKIKIARLENFDQKRRDIQHLIEQTERLVGGDEEQTFFKTAMDDELRHIGSQLRLQLTEARHNLIETQKQVIEYLNQVKFQSRLVEKIKQVKYLKDQFELKAKTNFVELLQKSNAVAFESKPSYPLRLSLDHLATDEALDSRKKVAAKFKLGRQNRLVAESISDAYLQTETEEEVFINLQALRNGFVASGKDLYQFVMEYNYPREVPFDEKLTVFCQLVSIYENEFNVKDDYGVEEDIEYAIVYPK
jgi:hypothetical protein